MGNITRIIDKSIWADELAAQIVALQERCRAYEEATGKMAAALDNMKHNSADSVSTQWAYDAKDTAGWSNKAIMAWAYRDLRTRIEGLTALAASTAGETK